MELLELLFVIFILYLLYKLVFGLILPVSKAATSVRDQMRNMQNNNGMSQPKNPAYNNYSPNHSSKTSSQSPKDSEYIDFEEIK